MKRILAAAAALSLVAAGSAPAVADHGRDGKGKAHKHAAKAHAKAVKRAQKAWRKGQHLPVAHRHHYVDPAVYGLPVARAGYRWVLVEDDAYLVRSDNGLIRDLVLNVLLGR
jgi:Ni/Co efflux regulator RcnB